MKTKVIRAAMVAAFLSLTAQASAVGFGGWVGYNFAAGVELPTCDASTTATKECSKGGMAIGGDLWLFGVPAAPIKFGVGAAYIPVSYQKYDITTGSSGSSSFVTLENKTHYIPVYAEARVDLAGFFAGITAGYGVSLSDVTVSGNTSSNSIVPASASGAFGIGGFAGYGVGLGPVSLEAGARLFNISGVTNIIPFVGATFSL